MGYYTHFDVTVSNLDNANQGIKVADMLDMSDYEFSDDGTIMEFYYDGKWYDWKEDCTRVSLKYPKILFEIEGKGEESGDIWKARVRNGLAEVVEAKIVFEPFKLVVDG